MKKIFLLLVVLNIISACQSAKDAFTLKKKSSIDEFLVEKKNPLVLPPEFGGVVQLLLQKLAAANCIVLGVMLPPVLENVLEPVAVGLFLCCRRANDA